MEKRIKSLSDYDNSNNSKTTTVVIIFLVITILLITGSGALYWWQTTITKQEQTKLETKITNLKNEVDLTKQNKEKLEKEMDTLLEEIENATKTIQKKDLLLLEKDIKMLRLAGKLETEIACMAEPTTNDIGRKVYPIHPKYYGLGFLGQLFTAEGCGQSRVGDLFGVDGENYTLGSSIYLFSDVNPSADLLDIFLSIGFKCADDSLDETCRVWRLLDVAKIENLLKLEPFHTQFRQDDCVNCG